MELPKATITAALLAATAFVAGNAQATAVQYQYGTTFTGNGPSGSTPWITSTFDDGGSAGSIRLTMWLNGLTSPENVSGMYFNLDPALNPTSLSFSYVGTWSTGPAADSISTGTDGFKADGDGKYDILFSFPTGSGFDAGEKVVYDITGLSALTANSFAYSSAPGSTSGGTGTYYAAAHVQNTTAPDGSMSSGWVAASTPPSTVPLPGAAWLFGSGLVGLAGFARRRRAG